MADKPIELPECTLANSVFDHLIETYVKSSLNSRIERGELQSPFSLTNLRGFQILFSPDGGNPIVRIDSEIRGVAKVRPKDQMEFQCGDSVFFDQIESFGEIGLSDEEADHGHATFLHHPSGSWIGYFDFTYYKGTARRHLAVAEQFLLTATICRDRRLWIAFADNLYSAAELAAKAALFCIDLSSEIRKTKKHGMVRGLFNKQRKIGNVDAAHSTALNKLWDARQKGRYLEEDLKFTEFEADEMLDTVGSLIRTAQQITSTFLVDEES